jgi:molybdenum cofactor cytidylyltransferase
MRFGEIASIEAVGAVLAHGLAVGARTFKKGRVLTPVDVAALVGAGIARVTVARLDPGEVGEDEAASRLAAALVGDGIECAAAFTGRVNLIATSTGLARIDAEIVDRLNAVDEALTVATLPAFEPVEAGRMVATIKIIPFAVSETVLEAALAILRQTGPAIGVAPLAPARVGLVQTRLAKTRIGVLEKTVAVTADRLSALGARLVEGSVVGHDVEAVADELRRMMAAGLGPLLVVGASATTDRRDVLPSAIVAAGGEIVRFGMPVDPGNLLVLGRIGATPVVVLPGCARSPKLNGFDFVLRRVLAGLDVGDRDIRGLGVGGLLGEISTRPHPRADIPPATARKRLAAIVLAAGASRRMGDANKLALPWNGRPMVCHPIDAALAAGFDPVVVVTGHDAERIEDLIGDRPVSFVHNVRHASGMASSIRCGLRALPRSIDGVAILLGDMPHIEASHLRRLVAAFAPEDGRAVVVPTVHGRWGNPILWGRRFFEEMCDLDGDRGARPIAEANLDLLAEVEMGDEAVTADYDTREAVRARLAEPTWARAVGS